MQNVLDEMRYKIELRYQGKGEPKEFQIVDNENRLSYVTLPALGGKRKSGKSEYIFQHPKIFTAVEAVYRRKLSIFFSFFLEDFP